MKADRLPRWIVIWFVISTAVVAWDVAFVLVRPRSMPGGDLAFLWAPYAKYVTVDLSYGDLRDGFVWAQALMSCLELVIAILALVASRRRRLPLATLLAFTASVLVAAKTLLIGLVQVTTDFASVGHNTVADLLLLYVLPNSVWIVVPLIVVGWTGRALVRMAAHSRA